MGVLVVEHEAQAGLGYLAGWLAASGITCDVVRPYLGEDLPRSAPGGLIVLGGEASAWDDANYPWLPATRELLRRSADDGVPTLGICLGAQLLTLACGGEVERGADGLEVGLCEVVPLPSAAGDPLFGHLAGPDGPGDPVVAVQYHRDAMTRLPAGAVLLATGDRYPHQGYRLGEAAWAVQFHPEATPEIFVGWTANSTDDLGPDADELNGRVKRAENELVTTWRPMAEGFAKVAAATRKTR